MTLLFIGTLMSLICSGALVLAFPSASSDDLYLSKLIVAENSDAAKNWANIPEISYVKVHIFNYTNIDRYFSGEDAKIKVQDLGPYTFQSQVTKNNIQFNPNNTITFTAQRSLKFIPEKSVGNLSDPVVFPNIFLLTFLKKHRESLNLEPKTLTKADLMFLFMKSDLFFKASAEEFMWGHSVETAHDLKNFGFLMGLNGSKSLTTLQIHTGVDDVNKLGIVSQLEGVDHLDNWGSTECNRIDGTAEFQFPPKLTETKQKLLYLNGKRKIPLHFEKEVISNSRTALRYSPPLNAFAKSTDNPENACYCDSSRAEECLPSGVMDESKAIGISLYSSFPHFFSGDQVLYSEFEGIEPNAEKHQFLIDIHPRLGFAMDGAVRIQLNVPFTKMDNVYKKDTGKMPDGLVLPVFWIEKYAPELNDAQKALIDEMANFES